MLGLGEHLPRGYHSTYVSYPESGQCTPFLAEARQRGFGSLPLAFDTPNMRDSLRELTQLLRSRAADILVTHTFKPNVLGRIAARRVGIPVVAVSRGWTWENLKVRVYESIDRVNLRFMDHVVAVSEGQAERVRKAGVPRTRTSVIRNAARLGAFAKPDDAYRARLRGLFPSGTHISGIVMAAGRLSPEKGFAVLLEAAVAVLRAEPTTGFVLFGEGGERAALEARIRELGLGNRFRMPGHTTDLDRYLPWADVVVLPSFTEGLPNVALEASAAGIPVVATAVGGTPEVIADGVSGYLVPSGNPDAIAGKLVTILRDESLRKRLGNAGRQRMASEFTFAAQAEKYVNLFESLRIKNAVRAA